MQETWVWSREPGFVPWVGKIPWRRKGYLLQYSGLENSMDCIVHGVAKSQTWLSDFHFTFSLPCCLFSPCLLMSHDFDDLRLENKGQSTFSWNSNTLATWWKELTHWKRPWCWERLRVGGEGDDRGRDGWMASPTQWTWVWVNSGSWWWTGRPGVLRFMGSQRIGHDWATELNWTT